MADEHEPYRPSNGTEGDCFYARWCAKCEREAEHRRDSEADGCAIYLTTMALDVDDVGYPKEWREDGPQGPRCTAFRPEGDDETLTPLDPGAVVRPLL